MNRPTALVELGQVYFDERCETLAERRTLGAWVVFVAELELDEKETGARFKKNHHRETRALIAMWRLLEERNKLFTHPNVQTVIEEFWPDAVAIANLMFGNEGKGLSIDRPPHAPNWVKEFEDHRNGIERIAPELLAQD